MPGFEGTHDRSAYLRVDVTGRSPESWAQLRAQLLSAINDLINSLNQEDLSPWFAEKAHKLNHLTLDLATQRMQASPEEAAHIAEQVQRKFSEGEREKIQIAREQQDLQRQRNGNAIRKLKLRLELTRSLVIAEPGEEAILFGNQLSEMIETLETFSQEA